MTNDELIAQRVTHDDAIAALNEIARCVEIALNIDARESIAHNIDAQRNLHAMLQNVRIYSQHVNAI